MGCNGVMPAGVNNKCGINFEAVKNIFVLKTGVTFGDVFKVQSQSEWIKEIRESLTVWVGKVVNSYEVTTDDKNIVSFASGKKASTTKPFPSGQFMLDTNFCDTKMLLSTLKNANNEVVFELYDGSLHMTRTADGKFKGFLGTLDIATKGIAQPSDVGNNTPMTFFSDSYDEFEAGVLVSLDWNATSVFSTYMPIGLDLSTSGIYNTGTGEIDVNVFIRCGDALTGLAVADFEIVSSSNLDTPAVTTVVDNGFGNYTLTLEKSAIPESLAIGDYMTIRVLKKTALVVDYVSNNELITVLE